MKPKLIIMATFIIMIAASCKKPPQGAVLSIDKTTMKSNEKATLSTSVDGNWVWISSFETDSTGSIFKSSGGGKSDKFYFDGSYEAKKIGTYKFYVEVYNCGLNKDKNNDGQPDCKSLKSNEVSITVTP